MKAISLWQPWASLMAIDAKRNETRSWPTQHRGLLAIHAAKKFDGEIKTYCMTRIYSNALREGHAFSDGVGLNLPLGAIVAVVNMTACVSTSPLPHEGRGGLLGRPFELEFGDYSPNRHVWVTRNLIRLPEPVSCRGMQGLFSLPSDVEAQVRAQMALAGVAK